MLVRISPRPHLPRFLLTVILAWLAALPITAQAPTAPTPPPDTAQPTPSAATPALAATRAEATHTRDSFVARVHTAGFTCPNPPPAIIVEDVPSFGQYNDETNTLRTSDWTVLNPENRASFLRLAGPNATEADAHTLFNLATHQWILIHELGHWWQNCNKAVSDQNPWKTEFDADRISLAYWREVDPTVVTRMIPIFHQVVTMFPDPTPPGQEMIPYFNAHYQQLGPTPAYRWYQSRMNVVADEERPIPTFPQILTAIRAPAKP